jgi:hypothetical protein
MDALPEKKYWSNMMACEVAHSTLASRKTDAHVIIYIYL